MSDPSVPLQLHLRPAHYYAASLACNKSVDTGLHLIYAEPTKGNQVVLVAVDGCLGIVAKVDAVTNLEQPVLIEPAKKQFTRKDIGVAGVPAVLLQDPPASNKLANWRSILKPCFEFTEDSLRDDGCNVAVYDPALLERIAKIGKALGGRFTCKTRSTQALIGTMEFGDIAANEVFLIFLMPQALHACTPENKTAARFRDGWDYILQTT